MNHNADQNYIHLLLQTLEKQEATLQEVLQVTKEQSSIADAPEFQEQLLEKSLNQKEVLIAKLNELDDGFAAVYGRVRGIIREHPTMYRDELEQMQTYIKRCTDIGVEIKVLEERNKDKLAQCFAQKHKQYGVRQTAATVASKYHRTMHPDIGNTSGFST